MCAKVLPKELKKCTPDEILDMALPNEPLITLIGKTIQKVEKQVIEA